MLASNEVAVQMKVCHKRQLSTPRFFHEFVSSLQMGSVGLIGGNEDRFMKTLGVLLHHWLPPRYPKNRDISAGKDN